jgi:hypothetical protein
MERRNAMRTPWWSLWGRSAAPTVAGTETAGQFLRPRPSRNLTTQVQ